MKTTIVTIKTSKNEVQFKLKLPLTAKEKSRGLSHIKDIAENEGMIFINKTSTISLFWMKDTFIPLDILFVDETKRIVRIHKNAIPLDEHNLISSNIPVKYIIEIKGGLTDKLGIEVGQYIGTQL